MQILIAAGLLLLLAGNSEQFLNPLALNAPDPWMVYHNGFFHLTYTTGSNKAVIRRASTLAGLSSAEETVVYTVVGGQLWAPEIHQVDGKWYYYYTSCDDANAADSCHRNRVAESTGDDPMGPYEHKADLGDFFALDPSLIKINDKLYLMGAYTNDGQQCVYIRELLNAYTPASDSVYMLSCPTYDWEKVDGNINEGPEALYHGDRTFIAYSACHCKSAEYKLGLLEFVGTNPLDSTHWKKYPNPVFQRDDDHNVYGPGHNGFFKSPDGAEDWIVYHANSSPDAGCGAGRSARAQKFTWGDDGLPVFGEPDAPGDNLAEPAGEP